MGVLGRTRKRYGVPRWSGSATIYKCLDAPGPCRFPALTSLCFIRRRTGRPGPSRNRKVKAWQGSRAPRHGPAIRMPGISTRPCGQAGSTEETPRRRTSYVVSLAVAMGPCRSPALSGVPGGFQTGRFLRFCYYAGSPQGAKLSAPPEIAGPGLEKSAGFSILCGPGTLSGASGA